jgi:hypothetical protein
MSIIEVQPIIVNANGAEDLFGDEPGTPQFYMVKNILYKHFGEDNIWVCWNYLTFKFNIEGKDKDAGCDMTHDYIDLIDTIYEPLPETFYTGNHLKFKIINIEY